MLLFAQGGTIAPGKNHRTQEEGPPKLQGRLRVTGPGKEFSKQEAANPRSVRAQGEPASQLGRRRGGEDGGTGEAGPLPQVRGGHCAWGSPARGHT